MKKLKMRMDHGKVEVDLEGDGIVTLRGNSPRVFLQINWTGGFDSTYCYLTAKRAERLRDWLTGWLAEQKKRKAKR